jgi:hypothetical protein
MDQEQFLPNQEKGISKHFERSLNFDRTEDARNVFNTAAGRLRSINEWDKYTGMLSADFTLTDSDGEEAHRMAEAGDYVKIAVPGPSLSQTNYDWVYVEDIREEHDALRDEEMLALTLRPCPDPNAKTSDVAHFFDSESSSNFVLTRSGSKLTIAYHGRNEVPNLGITRIKDKLRNLVMGIGAILGMSDIQWKNLISGLINTDDVTKDNHTKS